MMKRDYSKAVSIAIIAIIYAVAGAAGILAFGKLGAALEEPWALLAADVIATVIVWGLVSCTRTFPFTTLTGASRRR